jgi:hypothetical protein
MPEPTYIPAFGSVLTALELDDDGRIVIELKTVHTSMIGQRLNVEGNTYVTTGIERLEGFARVCEDSNTGVLNAKLTVEPTRPDPRTWNLIFYKTSAKTLAETITIMEKHAVELADRLRRGEPVPPFPGVAP